MTDSNPFANAEKWEASGGFLGAGDHVCDVLEIDGEGTSSGGHPQIEIRVGNADGSIKDWIVVIDSTLGKVNQLLSATGLDEYPPEGTFRPEGTGYRLSADYLKKLVGRKIGVIVRPEKDYRDPTQTRDRVSGYVEPSRIAKSDVTGPGDFAPVGAGVPESTDDIPF